MNIDVAQATYNVRCAFKYSHELHARLQQKSRDGLYITIDDMNAAGAALENILHHISVKKEAIRLSRLSGPPPPRPPHVSLPPLPPDAAGVVSQHTGIPRSQVIRVTQLMAHASYPMETIFATLQRLGNLQKQQQDRRSMPPPPPKYSEQENQEEPPLFQALLDVVALELNGQSA